MHQRGRYPRTPISLLGEGEPHRLGEYAGQYEMPAGGRMVFSIEDGKLMAALPGARRDEIAPEAHDRFFYRSADRVLAFRREGGEVAGVTVIRDGIEISAPRLSAVLPAPPK